MLKNTTDSFGSVAKFFHWLIALVVICLIFVGLFMDDIPYKAIKMQVYNLHKLTGLTILILVVLRLLWRFSNAVPRLPQMPAWEKFIEQFVKFALYACLFLMPISGWIFSSAAGHFPHIGGWQIPAPGIPENKAIAEFFKNVHVITAWTLIGLIGLHILGALKHHIINKDNVLRRMMPSRKK